MQKSILITGATGFVGSHLFEKLRVRKDLVIEKLDRSETPFTNLEKLSSIIRGKDIVIHLAAKIKGTSRQQNTGNVKSTEALLKAMSFVDKEKRPKLFVLASTFAVYKDQTKKITESTPTDPRNSYGKTKLESENLLRVSVKKLGITGIVLRFSNIYGSGAKPFSNVVSIFLDQIKNDQPITIEGDGLQKRDFIYIDDAVEAIVKAIDRKLERDNLWVFNICSGISASINKLVSILKKVVKKKFVVTYTSLKFHDNGCWIGSFSKAQKILGWKPKISLEKGLAKALK